MKSRILVLVLILLVFATIGCREDEPIEEPNGVSNQSDGDGEVDGDGAGDSDENPLLAVEETSSWELSGLREPAYVLRTEGNIPHIYAASEVDAARVHGFVVAQDRFFMMDLTRRLALGETAALLGQDGLTTDIQSRMTGSHYVAARMVEHASDDIKEILEAFADGINQYIDAASAGAVPYPSEVNLFFQILGLPTKEDMMRPFTPLDVTAMLATFIYQTSYSGSPVGRQNAYKQLDTLFEGDRYQELRRNGAREDVWGASRPIYPIASGAWGPLEGLASTMMRTVPVEVVEGKIPRVEKSLMERLESSLEAQHLLRGFRNDEEGFGSNAWAVSGAHTPDGASLMAADGHLSLGIPSILYNVGIDTDLLGDTGLPKQLGMVIPGIPYMALGTNGNVAYAFTQLFGDITDWYAEEIELDGNGAPVRSYFDGQWQDLEVVEESYEVARVQLLGSQGRTEVWNRYQTFDGRWLMDIEGTPVSPGTELEPGQTIVRTHSGWVIPGDVDGDGTITAISFTYGAHNMGDMLTAFRKMAIAENIEGFRGGVKGMLASSFNFVASDKNGDVFYTAFQGTPCRSYLPRDGSGQWIEGANPRFLLDGTTYGRFEIPVVDGIVDDSHQEDPYRCVIPFDESPQAFNPERGYVLTANNDPAGISFDSDLFNDNHYIGGPWYPGFRAEAIDRGLREAIAGDEATIESMARLQGHIESALGREFLPHLFGALDLAEDFVEATPILFQDWEERLYTDYLNRREQLLEARERLESWSERGHQARSGVETFYKSPGAEERDDAVATMIFNAYFRALLRLTIADENFPGIWQRGGGVGRTRLLYEMLASRGENVHNLSSFNIETGESAFFDDRTTEVTERSDELMVRALIEALDFLESEPSAAFRGGFGTDDMEQWLWGLRHQVLFESLLGGFISGQPALENLLRNFSITTERLPLAEQLESGDPRRGMRWFPRDGDQYAVDASNPGLDGDSFTYRSGPVMRMVVSLQADRVEGVNIIPGGQSGNVDSPFFDDQAALWLGNQTYPMRFELNDTIAGATGRESFLPVQ